MSSSTRVCSEKERQWLEQAGPSRRKSRRQSRDDERGRESDAECCSEQQYPRYFTFASRQLGRSYLSIVSLDLGENRRGARFSDLDPTSRGRISLISRMSLFVRIPASWNSRARLSAFLAARNAASWRVKRLLPRRSFLFAQQL